MVIGSDTAMATTPRISKMILRISINLSSKSTSNATIRKMMKGVATINIIKAYIARLYLTAKMDMLHLVVLLVAARKDHRRLKAVR